MFYCVQHTILASQFEDCRDVEKGNFSSLLIFSARSLVCLPIMRSIPIRSIICRRLTLCSWNIRTMFRFPLKLSTAGSFIGLNLSKNAVSDRKAFKLSCPIMRTLASSYVRSQGNGEKVNTRHYLYILDICGKCVYGNVRLSRQQRLFGDLEYATSYWLPLSSPCLLCTLMIKEKQLCEAINKLIRAKAGATDDNSFLSLPLLLFGKQIMQRRSLSRDTQEHNWASSTLHPCDSELWFKVFTRWAKIDGKAFILQAFTRIKRESEQAFCIIE